MKSTLLCTLLMVILFTSCSSGDKKVIVLFKKGTQIDESAKTITVFNGSGSQTKELYYSGGDKMSFQLKADGKESVVDIAGAGYYVVNASNDTIVGAYVNYSAPKKDTFTVTQEMFKKSIDSLTLLTEGKNISAANKNYFIPPYTAVKVTANMDAMITSPFHEMRTLTKDGDKDPEVYRFYTNNEIREKIEKQRAFTIAKPAATETPKKKN